MYGFNVWDIQNGFLLLSLEVQLTVIFQHIKSSLSVSFNAVYLSSRDHPTHAKKQHWSIAMSIDCNKLTKDKWLHQQEMHCKQLT